MDKNLQDCIDSIEEKLSLIMDKLGIDVPADDYEDTTDEVKPTRKKMVDDLTSAEE